MPTGQTAYLVFVIASFAAFICSVLFVSIWSRKKDRAKTISFEAPPAIDHTPLRKAA